jgi:2-oxo-4-hydroxy-4-carboxy-5-ureidoimidazoline decarboxylase
VKHALAEGNREYERKFGRIFIICASGKSAPDILENLQRRLGNDDAAELHEAAEQQRQIVQMRVKKWLTE